MDTVKAVLADAEDKMRKSPDVVNHNFAGIRSGRANPGIVENLRVDYYGTPTPLKQIANIAVPEPKMLLINPWDASALKSIEKAILESDIGINPVIDGKAIRLVAPTLTRERREELIKIAHKVAEDGHVALRSIRRDVNEQIKKIEKEKKITEDESFKSQTDIQKLTDKYIQLIDQTKAQKEKELSQF